MTIFDYLPPHVRGSSTSRAAAKETKPDIGLLQMRVLECVRKFGPVTDEEIQDLCGMNPNTERPRRIELVRKGLVKECGEKRTRAGRRATAWATT